MATCSPNDLLASAVCFADMPVQEQNAVIIQLLCNIAGGGSSSSYVNSLCGSFGDQVNALASLTEPVLIDSPFTGTIDRLSVQTVGGTCDVTVAINGTAVTGLDTVSASTTVSQFSATALNSIANGDGVTIEISNVSGATQLAFTIRVTNN